MADGYAVQTRQLTKAFRAGEQDLPVLKGVDLDIATGEFVSIMGPSGSGKSTLLNLVGLLDMPTSGAIRLMGTPTHDMSANQRATMRRQALGFVFQSFNLMPRLSALHNVMLPMAIAGVPRKQRFVAAKALLAQVGLGDRIHHRPAQLSGGQKQRVAVARALALDPPILLADEPTGNLDSATSQQLMQLFVRLNGAGKTILQVTHDEDMAHFGNRIVRFRDGKIVSEERKSAFAFEEPSFFLAHPRPRPQPAPRDAKGQLLGKSGQAPMPLPAHRISGPAGALPKKPSETPGAADAAPRRSDSALRPYDGPPSPPRKPKGGT